jgi:hypothetical protein
MRPINGMVGAELTGALSRALKDLVDIRLNSKVRSTLVSSVVFIFTRFECSSHFHSFRV